MVDLPLSRVYMYPFSCQGHYYLMFRYHNSAKYLRDNLFADWPFTKFHRNSFHGLRILVSHAQSDAAAGAV